VLLTIRAITLLLALITSSAFAQTAPQTIDGVTFQVPSGLKLEKVASSPLVERPIVASWDYQGRLLVLEAAGPVEREAETQGSRPHRLVRLVDEDNDGIFDRRIVAAEELSFPVGVLAIGTKHVLVSAPPEIWKLTDDDGDGICESREVWFNPGTATHCYNDLHGPYLGRDGWIYWTKGAFAAQDFTLRDGKPFTSTAAHIYRRRLEGGPIEAVMNGGMDNPVELAITPEGERFFTSTFLQHPAGGKRDGIAHAIYGGRYGKENDALNNHWSTGGLLPIMTHLGPAAPSGLALLESPNLLQDSALRTPADQAPLQTLIAAQFNLQEISLHRLVPQSASFRTEDQTLLATDWVQFHPTDILEDADGSLLVFDTGGWYDLCCPSLATDQWVAAGGFYRLTSESTRASRKTNTALPQSTAEALKQLITTSAWQKRNTSDWLVTQAQTSTPELIRQLSEPQHPLRHRQELLWLLCRIGDTASRKAIVNQLQSSEPGLRAAAAMAIAVHRWPEAIALHAAIAKETEPATTRSMAEALGRVGNRESIAPLMETIQRFGPAADRILQHSLTYALIELNQSDAIANYVDSGTPFQVSAALRALYERGDERLVPANVIPALNSLAARETALEILLAHPEWSSSLDQLLPEMFARAFQSAEARSALLALARQWGSQPAFQQLLATELEKVATSPADQPLLLLALLQNIRLENLPATWSDGLAALLNRFASSNAPELPTLLDWLRAQQLAATDHDSLVNALKSLGDSPSPSAVRAIASLPFGSRLPDSQLDALLTALEASDSDEATRTTWQALQRIRLDASRLQQLSETATDWNLANIDLAVQLFASQADADLNYVLLKRLEQVPLAKAIAPDQLRELYRPRGEELLAAAEKLISHLAAPAADTAAAVDSLLASLPEGEALRGLQVFRSTQTACSSCHQIAYVGGQIGPDLSRIGATRTRRELLEAIAFPSNRQEQSYRAEKFALLDGRVISGLVEERNGEQLVIRTGIDQRSSIRADEIDQRLPSELSLMPAGITNALTPQQLADLLAFLESRR
jgi:putative membrane-bound dehydrogenase-like protein